MDFHFSTVVWGPWHTGVFLDVNLPSLLAPDNLPAFAKKHRVTYRIFTATGDIPRIEASPAFQRAKSIVPFELVACPVEHAENPIAMHHQLWRRSIAEARQAGTMILFVPPDVIWANGSFRHVADLVEQGKRAVFMTYMRVISETCVPEARRRHLMEDGVTLNAPPRDLVQLCFEHIHPLTLTYAHDSGNFPIHPEFILWPVPGEGFLMRVLVREMFAYDPSLFELNAQALLAHMPERDQIHYISDSDDLFSLSLAPLMKDVEWYAKRQKLDPLKIGAWWLIYDSPANDIVAEHYFHMHSVSRTLEKWRPVEKESDRLMRRIAGTRELLRVLDTMTEEDTFYAREVLSMAVAETRLADFGRAEGPFTALIPKNAAVMRYLSEHHEEFREIEKSPDFVRRMLDHVLVGRIPSKPGHDLALKTVTGRTRQLTWKGATPLIDGVALRVSGFPLAKDWSYGSDGWAFIIDKILPPSSIAQSKVGHVAA